MDLKNSYLWINNLKNAAMKQLFTFIILILVIASCNKPIPAPDKQNPDNLIIPDSFNWKTTKIITVNIESDHSSVIEINSTDNNTRYYKGFYNLLEDVYPVQITIPAYVESIKVNGIDYNLSGSSLNVQLNPMQQATKKSMATITPVAFWHFNENSGTTATDAQNGYNGTINGATWVDGINGSALQFNGIDGGVTVPYTSQLDFTGNQLSLVLWFKLNNIGNDGCFIFDRVKYILRIDAGGKITFAIYKPDWASITSDWTNRIIDTDWHQVAATYDGSKMNLYVDGVLYKTANVTGNLNQSGSDVYIGNQSSLNFFKGIIDEVSVYNQALSAGEIADLYNTSQNPGTGADQLMSEWKMDENSGTAVDDNIGSNNGTLVNATWTTGVEGNCLNFNGTSSNVSIPDNASLNLSQTVSLSAWVNTRENKTAKIAQKGDWDGYGLGQDKWGGWQCHMRASDDNTYSLTWGNGVPQYNEWYFVTMTYDGDRLKLYVNGQLKNSRTVGLPLHVNTRPFSIGSDNAAQKFFNGLIDDVKLYGSALSQTQVQAAMTTTSIPPDSDGDGIADAEDEYPNDPARAFNNYYPSVGTGSLAFEDLWPSKGDYDFNDLVTDYHFKTVTSGNNKITEIIGTFIIRANGAGLRNGFGFQLPGNVSENDITVTGYNLTENYIQMNENGTEADQNKATVIVFDNIRNVLQSPEGFGANVIVGQPYITPDTIVITMAFTPNSYDVQDVDLSRFNPFLIIDMERGKEIHLPDDPPTALANTGYFGTMDDNSDPAVGRYYKSTKNMPWAINLPQSFDYTIETVPVTQGYLKFGDWAESGGLLYTDWYKDMVGYRNNAEIYQVPD